MARPKREAQLSVSTAEFDQETIVDLGQVRAARQATPENSTTLAMASLFATLGDPTRLRVAAALDGRELCVSDIAAAVGLSVSAASHQLRVLRRQGLVRQRKAGRLVYYTLDDEHVQMLYRQALDHVSHQEHETEQ